MKKTTRNPFFRMLLTLFHTRYLRRNNFKMNTLTLERLEASVREQRELRSSDPKLFASSGFHGPFSKYN